MKLLRVTSLIAFLVAFYLSYINDSLVFAEDKNYELYIAQGIRQIHRGNYDEALELLQKAMAASPENSEITYYAGVAASRLGRYEEAEELLSRTVDLDETAIEAYLELVRLYYVTSRCGKAQVVYRRFTALSDEKELSREAARLIQACQEIEAKKRYSLNLLMGGVDDSNVILEPDNPAVAAGNKSDTRAVINLTADALLLTKKSFDLKVNYNLYQTLQRHLTDFNVSYQKIMPELEWRISDLFVPAAGYALEYILFGNEDYSRVHTYFGKIAVHQGDTGTTEAVYEYRDHKYWDTELFTANSIRTGHTNTLGIKQSFATRIRAGNFYYFHDWDRTERDYWDFNGYRAGGEAVFQVSSFYLNVSGEFSQRRYRGEYPTLQKKRKDRTQEYTIGITHYISDRVGVTLSDTYVYNDSNLDSFDYTENIAGIYLRLGVL